MQKTLSRRGFVVGAFAACTGALPSSVVALTQDSGVPDVISGPEGIAKTEAADQPFTKHQLRLTAKTLASSICNKFLGTDKEVYQKSKKAIEAHMIKYQIHGSSSKPKAAQMIRFLNKYKNDMYCRDQNGNLENYMARAIRRRRRRGIFSMLFTDDLMAKENYEVLINVNAISKFGDRYETVLDTVIRECKDTNDTGICRLKDLFEDLNAKTYAQLTDAEKNEFSPLEEAFASQIKGSE
jgi:hypothetical protein